ncbi:HTTM domain-containing protein [Balamuthia mandrillaris]
MKRKKKTAAKTTTTPSPPPSPSSRSLPPRPDPSQQHQDDGSPPTATATHDRPSFLFSASSLRRFLFSPIDPAGLALFRLFWGLLMFYELFTMLSHDMHKARLLYRSTQLRFQYSTAFCWEPPLAASLTAMWWLLTLSALCAFLVAVGLCYRLAAVGLLLGLAYFYLLEEATYLNHYYLMLVVQFIMCCVPANATFAVDNLVWPSSKRKAIPSWTLNWLRAEMSLVYFFAGVAKCNEDWLRGQPLRIWLPRRKRLPWPLGAFLASSVGAYVFSIAGLLFDLSIGFLLWPSSSSSCPSCSSSCSTTTKNCCRGDGDCKNASWRRRWKVQELAMTATFIFHLLNKAIFNIGIFPILCLAATTLYLDPSWPRAIADRYGPMRAWRDMKELYRLLMEKEEGEEEMKKRGEEERKKEKRAEEEAKRQRRRRRGWKRREIVVAVLLLIFFVHQTLVPLRFLLYEGNVAWTEYGHRYSWRMKLRDKQCNATVTLEVDVPLSFFLLSSSSSSDNQTSPFFEVNDSKFQQKEEKKEGIVRLQAQIPLEQHLNRRQMGNALSKPSSLIQIACFLSARWTHDHSNEIQQWEKLNHKEGWEARNDFHLIFVPRVYISSMCSLNGRKAQLLVDPLADLASFSPYEAEPYSFVLPLEPLSEEEKQELVWNVVWRWLFSDPSSS